MSRRKKYTAATLRKSVERYFKSITREIKLTEKVPTDKRDSYGHVIYEAVPVINALGEQAAAMEYLVPPTIGGLCIYLGVKGSTWSRWQDKDKYPEFMEIIEYVNDRMLAWRKEQVLVRKDVKGIIWDLEVNHGCRARDDADKSPAVTVLLEGGADEYVS